MRVTLHRECQSPAALSYIFIGALKKKKAKHKQNPSKRGSCSHPVELEFQCSSSPAWGGSAGAGWMDGDGFSEQGMPAVLGAGLAWSALSWLLHTSPFGRDKRTASLVYHFNFPAGWAAALVLSPDLLPNSLRVWMLGAPPLKPQ